MPDVYLDNPIRASLDRDRDECVLAQSVADMFLFLADG